MKKLNQAQKKRLMRILILVMAVVMALGFVMLPLMQMVSAEEDAGVVSVDSFETGSLAAAIEEAKDGTDLNLITELDISDGVLNAADYSAICGYPNIEYLRLDGCETENGIIPENALSSRNRIVYISLPKNTVTIGERAFSGNRTLEEIVIPDTLRNIGDYAFEGCERVEEFDIPAELLTLGTGAFYDCKSLKSFTLPAAITEIPESCFLRCSLTEIHIGPQVTAIGKNAFADCHSLADIYYYGQTLPIADESAFQNLKVTFHVYEGSEEFDELNGNFVSVSDDMGEDIVYTAPETVLTEPAETTAEASGDTSDTENIAEESESEALTEVTSADNGTSADAPDFETEAQSENVSSSQGFSAVSVIVIAVLCAAVGVLGALLFVKSKK